ncbi:hypothetical protein B0H13DRAFT_1596805, partial [Mycena leptocephala]
RLPEGMKRIGYDADTARYTFCDRDGNTYIGPPHEEYGVLAPVPSGTHDRPQAFASGEFPRNSICAMVKCISLCTHREIQAQAFEFARRRGTDVPGVPPCACYHRRAFFRRGHAACRYTAP